MNRLYYGDNLDVLRRHVEDASVDLVYLDPPSIPRASPWGKHARLQIITVEDLLTGKAIDRPPIQTSVTFKRAPKVVTKEAERKRLDFDGPSSDEPF